MGPPCSLTALLMAVQMRRTPRLSYGFLGLPSTIQAWQRLDFDTSAQEETVLPMDSTDETDEPAPHSLPPPSSSPAWKQAGP